MRTLSLIIITSFLSACGGITIKTNNSFEQVELPDNSMVYLNNNSSITYDEAFTTREVKLTGEAFFSIVKDNQPFVVKTQLGDIKVLGTEFNVNSAAEQIEVEVEEVSVEVKAKGEELKTQIRKGEKALLKSTNKVIDKAKAEYKHSKWRKDMENEFKKLGKEIKKSSKKIGKSLEKEGKSLGKDIKKETKKLKKNLN